MKSARALDVSGDGRIVWGEFRRLFNPVVLAIADETVEAQAAAQRVKAAAAQSGEIRAKRAALVSQAQELGRLKRWAARPAFCEPPNGKTKWYPFLMLCAFGLRGVCD